MIPRWQTLPEGPLRNQEMVDYLKASLKPLFQGESFISTTRIQNYVKWGVMSPPVGRRYYRLHLAEAMVLTVLKTVLTTEEISRGIRLQLLLLGTQEAYNAFCQSLEEALEEVRLFESEGKIYPSQPKYPALSAASRAFAYACWTRERIQNPSQIHEVKHG